MSYLPQMRGVMNASACCRLLTWQLAEEIHLPTQFLTIRLDLLLLAPAHNCLQAQVTKWSLERFKCEGLFQVICNFGFLLLRKHWEALIYLLSFFGLPDKGISQKKNISNPRTAELHCWATNYASTVSHCLTVSKFHELCHILVTHQ